MFSLCDWMPLAGLGVGLKPSPHPTHRNPFPLSPSHKPPFHPSPLGWLWQNCWHCTSVTWRRAGPQGCGPDALALWKFLTVLISHNARSSRRAHFCRQHLWPWTVAAACVFLQCKDQANKPQLVNAAGKGQRTATGRGVRKPGSLRSFSTKSPWPSDYFKPGLPFLVSKHRELSQMVSKAQLSLIFYALQT